MLWDPSGASPSPSSSSQEEGGVLASREGMESESGMVGDYRGEKIGASYLLSEQVSNTVWPKYILSHSVSYANATSRNQLATKVDSASRLHSTCP